MQQRPLGAAELLALAPDVRMLGDRALGMIFPATVDTFDRAVISDPRRFCDLTQNKIASACSAMLYDMRRAAAAKRTHPDTLQP